MIIYLYAVHITFFFIFFGHHLHIIHYHSCTPALRLLRSKIASRLIEPRFLSSRIAFIIFRLQCISLMNMANDEFLPRQILFAPPSRSARARLRLPH